MLIMVLSAVIFGLYSFFLFPPSRYGVCIFFSSGKGPFTI